MFSSIGLPHPLPALPHLPTLLESAPDPIAVERDHLDCAIFPSYEAVCPSVLFGTEAEA